MVAHLRVDVDGGLVVQVRHAQVVGAHLEREHGRQVGQAADARERLAHRQLAGRFVDAHFGLVIAAHDLVTNGAVAAIPGVAVRRLQASNDKVKGQLENFFSFFLYYGAQRSMFAWPAKRFLTLQSQTKVKGHLARPRSNLVTHTKSKVKLTETKVELSDAKVKGQT